MLCWRAFIPKSLIIQSKNADRRCGKVCHGAFKGVRLIPGPGQILLA
jgi:hypothetical protein